VRSTAPRQRGVSLLEMLVALTILATAGAILFGWVYQSSTQLQRLNNQQLRALAQLQALQFIKQVNPALAPAGRQAFADFVLTWQADATTPLLATLDDDEAPMPTRVAIFDVKLALLRDGDAQPWVEFRTQLAGWRSVARGTGAEFNPGASGGMAK